MHNDNRIAVRMIKTASPILSALKRMDEQAVKSLMVSNDNKHFEGLLSIGDIQRAIIKGVSLNEPVSHIMRANPRVLYTDQDAGEVKEMMIRHRMEFLPVVDEHTWELLNVYFWSDFFADRVIGPASQFNLPVVIMAGGLGTRLKPLTNVLPKPLIPLGDKTIIEHIFDRFALHGCTDFFISVNYKAELIEYYLNEQNLSYNLSFFKEAKPLGTAGSLSLLKGKIDQTFFVSNCDIIIEQDYSEILEFHRANHNEITIVAALKHYPIPYGIVETGENGMLDTLIEKPELTFKINSGMYIIEPHLLNEIPVNENFHITQLIEKVLRRKGKIGVFPVSEKSWKDIGEWDELLKTQNSFV
jgi:dTDP-glucose pyrophosphorylase